MGARRIERWEQRLQRATRCQNVIYQQHACSWWNLKAATELATCEPIVSAHLFREEPANPQESAHLIRQEDASCGWPNDEVNVTTKHLNVLEALHRECVRDLCSGRGMLQ
jgi:hypothetical protein